MLESLLNELRGEGQLRGEISPPMPEEADVSHWIVALQVIGGWLAAIFMLLFLGMGAAPWVKGASSWMVAGLIMTALTSLLIGRVGHAGGPGHSGQSSGTLLRQFLLVASLAGHGALIIGASMFGKGGASFLLLALYEAVLLLYVSWMPHRLVAALVGGGALVAAIRFSFSLELAHDWLGVYWFVACLLWLQESRWQALRYAEAVYALASALTLLCFAYALSGFVADNLAFHQGFRFDAALVSAANIVSVLLLARPLMHPLRSRFAVLLLLAALAVTWQAPAIGMGALALVFGFARGHRWLMWLGGALLVLGVGRFYYDLQLILLHKSGLMVLGGLLLLAVRALIVGREDGA